MDFGDVLYQKPYGVVSPVFGMIGDAYGYLKGVIDNNRSAMNENSANVIRTLKGGLPLGVVGRNAINFWKSINAGADAEGKYPIFDDAGKMIDSRDFNDVFWGTLMGFPTVAKVNERNLYQDIKNRVTETADIKAQIDTLLRQGKYDEMDALINKTGIMPSQSAMEAYYTPRTQRAFNSAPMQVKAEFAPRVFPDITQ